MRPAHTPPIPHRLIPAHLIDYLDDQDGDEYLEYNGDELDGSGGEDDFRDHSYSWRREPGCPIGDPDIAVDDYGCDDINDDREEEHRAVPIYGIDQRHALIGPDGVPYRR